MANLLEQAKSLYRVHNPNWASNMREINPDIDSEVRRIDQESRKLDRGGQGYRNARRVRIFELSHGEEHIAVVTSRNSMARTAAEAEPDYLHTTDAALKLISLSLDKSSFGRVPSQLERRMVASGLVTDSWAFIGTDVDTYTFRDSAGQVGFYVAVWGHEGAIFYTLNAPGKRILGIE